MPENLLVDEEELHKFVDKVVPRLSGDEVLTAILAARRKYSPVITRSEELVAYAILKNSSYSYLERRLKRLGYVNGLYVDYKRTPPVIIPPEAFVMYIDLHPKSTLKACHKLVSELWNDVLSVVSNPEAKAKFVNTDRHWFSAVCRSQSRKPYYLIDVDEKNGEALDELRELLEKDIIWISETRGGYHIIANNENPEVRIFCKNGELHISTERKKWEKLELRNKAIIEVQYHQCQTPIPGSLQGGWLVREVK